jgi:hypothetical protein
VTREALAHDRSARVFVLFASGERADVLEAVEAGADRAPGEVGLPR